MARAAYAGDRVPGRVQQPTERSVPGEVAGVSSIGERRGDEDVQLRDRAGVESGSGGAGADAGHGQRSGTGRHVLRASDLGGIEWRGRRAERGYSADGGGIERPSGARGESAGGRDGVQRVCGDIRERDYAAEFVATGGG